MERVRNISWVNPHKKGVVQIFFHSNKEVLKTKEIQKKEIEKIRDRDRSALRKKETEKGDFNLKDKGDGR